MNVFTEGFKYLSDNLDSIGIGGILAGIGGIVVKVITAWISKKVQEKKKSIEDFRDEVETIKIRQEGQESFVKTLQDHETRIQVLETIVDTKMEEFIENKYEEKRKVNIPVKVERRIKKRKVAQMIKTDLDNK